jgi:hypothetical protein
MHLVRCRRAPVRSGLPESHGEGCPHFVSLSSNWRLDCIVWKNVLVSHCGRATSYFKEQ